MIKRCATVSLLLLAFTLVLAHSIIPHHHHDVAVETSSENHEHRNENALEHSFEHYLHSGSSYDYFIKNDFTFDQPQVVTHCVSIYLNFDFRLKTPSAKNRRYKIKSIKAMATVQSNTVIIFELNKLLKILLRGAGGSFCFMFFKRLSKYFV